MTPPAFVVSPLDVFSERFAPGESVFQDPAFLYFRGEDRQQQDPVTVQLLAAPGLRHDENLQRQWEAMRDLPDRLWFRPRDLLREGDGAALLSWAPPGRRLSEVKGTLADEVYWRWLGEALRDLDVLHRAGLLHLAQGENTWLLFQGEEGAEESLGLANLFLFPDLMLGARVTPPVLAAVAPELLQGAEVDARADLYSLACLILAQRAAHGMGALITLKDWVEAQRQGSLLQLIPEAATPLNEMLRAMLQTDPQARPRDAVELLRQIFPHESFSDALPLSDLARERVRRRRSHLVLSTLYSLIREGEAPAARVWMESLSPEFRAAHEPYLHYLEALAQRRQKNPDAASEAREQAIRHLPERQDKKLQVLLLLEEARALDALSWPEALKNLLAQAQRLADEYPDPDLQAKVLVEQAALFKILRRDLDACDALRDAEARTARLTQCLVRGKVLRDLADLMAQNGLGSQALQQIHESLAAVEAEPAERARREIEAGLIEWRYGDFSRSREHFIEGKYLYSTLKDLPALVWATAHEVRAELAGGDPKRARREFRALRLRARGLEHHLELLDRVDLMFWLESGEAIDPQFESWKLRIEADMASATPEKIFRELVWSPVETWELYGRYAKKIGRADWVESFQVQEKNYRETMRDYWKGLGLQPVPPRKLSPMPEPTQLAREPEMDLQKENRQLRERVQQLEAELLRLKEKKTAPSKPRLPVISPSPAVITRVEKSAAPTDLGSVAHEGTEREAIEAALRRHQGNRNQTAVELKIHRRTLFEKMQKYGLDQLTFDPTREDIVKALEESQGKKNLAAEKLGLSRSSFYRRLKELGLG